ncbi:MULTISPECIES: late competence protein ComER [Shouchella]|uniref:Late competence protein ComER n=2 Tax=Shouchella TaxID=2893057 RepID=A0ABY7W2V5_9BACI|nr:MULTISPECIES: late competence protein ComER [Shouchella]MED4127854.1 late competence protein ComER [Shouchella miscanthi]WDF03003.1 late competence protein ComER [Shouchella hunanensis]
MKIGFIGTGSMGSMLIDTLLEAKTIKEEDIVIINRTIEKAIKLKEIYPAIHIASDIEELTRQCRWIFICVKPKDIPSFTPTVIPYLSREHVMISITSPVSIHHLEELFPCKVARIIPSILNRAQSGSTLVSFSSRCTSTDEEAIISFVSSISRPLFIDENVTRVSSDIVSCGPAFFAFMAQRFIEGAVSETPLGEKEATELTTSMLIGLGKLLQEGYYTLPTLQERVCVPGGITGVGIAHLDQLLGEGFGSLFRLTEEKYATEKKKLAQEFQLK